jgi:hypothetical protein
MDPHCAHSCAWRLVFCVSPTQFHGPCSVGELPHTCRITQSKVVLQNLCCVFIFENQQHTQKKTCIQRVCITEMTHSLGSTPYTRVRGASKPTADRSSPKQSAQIRIYSTHTHMISFFFSTHIYIQPGHNTEQRRHDNEISMPHTDATLRMRCAVFPPQIYPAWAQKIYIHSRQWY